MHYGMNKLYSYCLRINVLLLAVYFMLLLLFLSSLLVCCLLMFTAHISYFIWYFLYGQTVILN